MRIETSLSYIIKNVIDPMYDDETFPFGLADEITLAIVKQIPKVVITSFGWICPNCNKEFVSDRTEYCMNCGQHLKFE